jgi:hypothetical protein
MAFPPADIDPVTKWSAIILALLTILYATLRPLFRKKDPLQKPPAFGSLAQQRAVERQMQNVLVEMSDMARQISAQIDTRAAKLEELIRQADERIAAMKSQPAGFSGTPPATPDPAPAQPQQAPIVDARHAQIYALADLGHSSRDIAQQLNRPSGEIELILALRR